MKCPPDPLLFFSARRNTAGQISPQSQRIYRNDSSIGPAKNQRALSSHRRAGPACSSGDIAARFYSVVALPEGSLARNVRTRITRFVPRIQKTSRPGGRQAPPCWGAAASFSPAGIR